jgi:HTH-type transcriptional regulator, competence development regulator
VEFRDYLKEKCRERGISLHRLALLCDLNQIYFYQAVNKNKENPPPWVLRRAAPHLGVPYVELLMAAGYLQDADLAEWQEHHRRRAASGDRTPAFAGADPGGTSG